MSEFGEFDRAVENIEAPRGDGGRVSGRPGETPEDESPVRRIVVDQQPRRVRLENEAESGVTAVVEGKGGEG